MRLPWVFVEGAGRQYEGASITDPEISEPTLDKASGHHQYLQM